MNNHTHDNPPLHEQPWTLDDALDDVKISTVGEIRDADLGRQMANAKRSPRSLKSFLNRLEEVCTLSEEVAGSCTYSLPRGGKRIVGPSVRFAELVVHAYGNLHITPTTIDLDDNAAICNCTVLDLENNTSIEATVRRRVTKKRGKKTADEDMKNLAVASGHAIAFRNAVFKAVPRALWEPVWRKSHQAASGRGTMKQRREAALGLYEGEFGATEKQVLDALGRAGIEEITLQDLAHLRGMVTAIRSGELAVDDALRPPEEPKPRRSQASETGSLAKKLEREPTPEPGSIPLEQDHDAPDEVYGDPGK